MNKTLLLKHILDELEAVYQVAVDAAMLAYNSATHDENVAESKYDTLGLEASYLAQGQAQRVTECKADLSAFKKLTAMEFSEQIPIAIGALITLKDNQGAEKTLFLGPAAGGLKLIFSQKEMMIITPSAPLGQALLGHFIDDYVEVNVAGQKQDYEITAVV
ncbi:MAG: transcription elongation factor [Gammaproteobacteria bacterium]|nr:transcription elongation factor [Gammaproteobacteria bacterium]